CQERDVAPKARLHRFPDILTAQRRPADEKESRQNQHGSAAPPLPYCHCCSLETNRVGDSLCRLIQLGRDQPRYCNRSHGCIVWPGTTVSIASAPSLDSSTTICRSPFTPFSTWTFPEGHWIVKVSTVSASARPKWTMLGAWERKPFAGYSSRTRG